MRTFLILSTMVKTIILIFYKINYKFISMFEKKFKLSAVQRYMYIWYNCFIMLRMFQIIDNGVVRISVNFKTLKITKKIHGSKVFKIIPAKFLVIQKCQSPWRNNKKIPRNYTPAHWALLFDAAKCKGVCQFLSLALTSAWFFNNDLTHSYSRNQYVVSGYSWTNHAV